MMNYWYPIIKVSYHLFAYTILFTGIWLLVRKQLFSFIGSQIEAFRFMKSKKLSNHNRYNRHIEMLLKSNVKNYSVGAIERFYYISIMTSILAFVLVYRISNDVYMGLGVAVGCLFGPYLIHWVRLLRKRATASYDLLPAATKLLQKYRAHNHNIYHALRETVNELDGTIKSAFYLVLNAIQHRRNVEDSVNLFHFQINTSSSLQIAILILEGVKKDINIDNGLSRVIGDMTNTSILIEKEKSDNRDAIQLGYFPIFAVPITLLLNHKLSSGRALYYYFQHPLGVKILLLVTFICFFSFMVALILAKPKNDL